MDQCKYCTLREKINECEKADCNQHESWYAQHMKNNYIQIGFESGLAQFSQHGSLYVFSGCKSYLEAQHRQDKLMKKFNRLFSESEKQMIDCEELKEDNLNILKNKEFADLKDVACALVNMGFENYGTVKYCFNGNTTEENLYLATGGWSDNEDMIQALQENLAFWAQYWVKTERGGAYYFERNLK